MKKIIITLLLTVLVGHLSWSQTKKYIEHKVQKSDNLTQIAKKYNVSQADILKLNPDAQNGLKENTIILIPNTKATSNVKPAASKIVKHEVLPKETLYGISKKYGVEIADIEKANQEALKEGVKIGLILTIPVKGSFVNKDKPKTELPKITVSKNPIFHIVKPKETKYSIAKQYDTTIEKLEKLNPEIVAGLPEGFNLLISGERPKVIETKPIATEVKPEVISEMPKKAENTYVVKPKETLYSISNQLGVSQEELIALNPELKDGVQEGATIKIPVKVLVVAQKKNYKDLAKSFKSSGNKKLALLLPFNIAKLDQDTINSTKSRLKKDKFLNMTLDFYAGALIAIDSVKKMGMNADIKILDSDETRSSSNVPTLISSQNLKSMDAIIGPFYQNNVEKTADLLSESNVPVISPLSKDYDKSYRNLYQATPTNDDVKNAMFDFMREKNGNMIAIVDPKKLSVKQFILENHKDVAFAEYTDGGTINTESLKLKLIKDRLNFVIMETERTGLILNTLNVLSKLQSEYQIKLVILGENEALDFEEISINRLTKLQLHYPSLAKVNDTPEATIFENTFRKKNKVLPNQFATRGFDITFDVLMRLSQDKTFEETINESATEQVENKFSYISQPKGGYINKGIHILYYDKDLTIKEAK
jgi:LysM repeat protein